MVETRTQRLGLPQWSAGTDGPSRADFNEAFLSLETLAALDQQGPLTSRPAAGKRGLLWTDPATTTTYRDTGVEWVTVGGGAMMPKTGGTFTGPVTAQGSVTVVGPAGATSGGYYQVGDDVRIVDAGIANTVRVVGVQNPAAGEMYSGEFGTIRFWHAGNDGANSGLDADKLDGREGADYRAVTQVASAQAALISGATDFYTVSVTRATPFTVTASANMFLEALTSGSVWSLTLRFYVVGGAGPVDVSAVRQPAIFQATGYKTALQIPSTVLSAAGFGGGTQLGVYLTVARETGSGTAALPADYRFNRLDVVTHPV